MHSFLHALQRSVAGTPIALQLAGAWSWRAGLSTWLR